MFRVGVADEEPRIRKAGRDGVIGKLSQPVTDEVILTSRRAIQLEVKPVAARRTLAIAVHVDGRIDQRDGYCRNRRCSGFRCLQLRRSHPRCRPKHEGDNELGVKMSFVSGNPGLVESGKDLLNDQRSVFGQLRPLCQKLCGMVFQLEVEHEAVIAERQQTYRGTPQVARHCRRPSCVALVPGSRRSFHSAVRNTMRPY